MLFPVAGTGREGGTHTLSNQSDQAGQLRTPQQQARAARLRLFVGHQALWTALAAAVAVSAAPFLPLPPALHGVLAGVALLFAIRGALTARRERERLLAVVGPAPKGPAGSPPQPQLYAMWRGDPRTVVADSFARATIWWSCSAAFLVLYLVAYLALRGR